jgi:hypothetical protein
VENGGSATLGSSPQPDNRDSREGFGCFVIVLVLLICGAAGTMFAAAGPGGAPWAALGVWALSAMGLGIVYFGVKYHG